MKIGIVTQFLPRLELDHLEEWISYHLKSGIDRLYLYNNGHVSRDNIFGKGITDRVWQKKPEANYHLELSDQSVDEKINRIIEKYSDHIIYRHSRSKNIPFLKLQLLCVNKTLNELHDNLDVEILAHIDIDELLVCDQSLQLKNYLVNQLEEFSAIELSQKVFESRFKDGQSIPFYKLNLHRGVTNVNPKFICKVAEVKRWLNPHKIELINGSISKVDPSLLRFHHFRGFEHHGKVSSKWVGIAEYQRMSHLPLQFDNSHSVFSIDI